MFEIKSTVSAGATMYAIVPQDGTRGFVIGEMFEAKELRDKLTALLEIGKVDGEIDSHDEQLGAKWLTTSEAARLVYSIRGERVSERTIRYACKNGHIQGAEMQGRDWRFPQMGFLAWCNNRPKPGRKAT